MCKELIINGSWILNSSILQDVNSLWIQLLDISHFKYPNVSPVFFLKGARIQVRVPTAASIGAVEALTGASGLCKLFFLPMWHFESINESLYSIHTCVCICILLLIIIVSIDYQYLYIYTLHRIIRPPTKIRSTITTSRFFYTTRSFL